MMLHQIHLRQMLLVTQETALPYNQKEELAIEIKIVQVKIVLQVYVQLFKKELYVLIIHMFVMLVWDVVHYTIILAKLSIQVVNHCASL